MRIIERLDRLFLASLGITYIPRGEVASMSEGECPKEGLFLLRNPTSGPTREVTLRRAPQPNRSPSRQGQTLREYVASDKANRPVIVYLKKG